jgi:hypothetical protein
MSDQEQLPLPESGPRWLIGTGKLNKGVVGTYYDTITCKEGSREVVYLRVETVGINWPKGAILGAPPEQWGEHHAP